MTLTRQVTRAEVQAARLRAVIGFRDMSIAELHRDLSRKSLDVGSYNTFRSFMKSEANAKELSTTVIVALSKMLDAERDFIEGADGAYFDALTMGVWLSSLEPVAA